MNGCLLATLQRKSRGWPRTSERLIGEVSRASVSQRSRRKGRSRCQDDPRWHASLARVFPRRAAPHGLESIPFARACRQRSVRSPRGAIAGTRASHSLCSGRGPHVLWRGLPSNASHRPPPKGSLDGLLPHRVGTRSPGSDRKLADTRRGIHGNQYRPTTTSSALGPGDLRCLPGNPWDPLPVVDEREPASAGALRACVVRHPDTSTIESGSRGAASPHSDCKRRRPVRVRSRLTQGLGISEMSETCRELLPGARG